MKRIINVFIRYSGGENLTDYAILLNLNSTNVKKEKKSRLYLKYNFYSFQGIFFIIDSV